MICGLNSDIADTFAVFCVRIAGGVHDLWLNTDIADTFAVFSVRIAGGVPFLLL